MELAEGMEGAEEVFYFLSLSIQEPHVSVAPTDENPCTLNVHGDPNKFLTFYNVYVDPPCTGHPSELYAVMAFGPPHIWRGVKRNLSLTYDVVPSRAHGLRVHVGDMEVSLIFKATSGESRVSADQMQLMQQISQSVIDTLLWL
jgi:hypothetical protein